MCRQACRAEEACKAEEAARAEAARKAEEERQAELARERVEAERWARVEVVQEAHIECQRQEFEVQKAQEQQQRSQARAEAIAATQGSGEATAEPAAATGGRRSACVKCREHLNNPVGCVAQASSKATVCARCQAAHKSCSWSTEGKAAESSTVAGSGTEAGGAVAPKRAARRRQWSEANTSPKGASKCKKACNTTEEDKADEEEVFRVPRAMAEEQRDALGMLTQTLAQLAEQMGALEVREREQMMIERERLELERECLELERRHTVMEERRMAKMDRIMVTRRQFIQGLSMGATQKEITAVEQVEENGADGDDEEGMADVEGEED